MSEKGHNSVAGEELERLITRVEQLEEEKAGLTTDIREVYAEAKGNGFDVKIMREVVRRRRMDAMDREAHDELRDMYERALGMFG